MKNNKLKLNKKSIVALSSNSKKLSKKQQQQVAGGKYPVLSANNTASWECCEDSRP
ncbi:MAG: hypothetical protein HRT38_10655 [Alteromonadaceae bacterium]|nr:hypothetical protein [Alteromonadaceae bacterium]